MVDPITSLIYETHRQSRSIAIVVGDADHGMSGTRRCMNETERRTAANAWRTIVE